MADIAHSVGPGFAPLIPYEIQRMKETGLLVYDEPLGPESLLRFPHAEHVGRASDVFLFCVLHWHMCACDRFLASQHCSCMA